MVKKSGNNLMLILLMFAVAFAVVMAVNLVNELISPDPDVVKFDTTQFEQGVSPSIEICTSLTNSFSLICDDIAYDLFGLNQEEFDKIIENCPQGILTPAKKCIGDKLELNAKIN